MTVLALASPSPDVAPGPTAAALLAGPAPSALLLPRRPWDVPATGLPGTGAGGRLPADGPADPPGPLRGWA